MTFTGDEDMRRLALILILGSAVVACPDSFSPDGVADAFPAESVVGAYDLISFDGNPIPFTIQPGPGTLVTLESGRLTLTTDETWMISHTFSYLDGSTTSTATDTSSGTYALTEPNTIRFREDQEDEDGVGTIEGGRITLIFPGVVLVYEKPARGGGGLTVCIGGLFAC